MKAHDLTPESAQPDIDAVLTAMLDMDEFEKMLTRFTIQNRLKHRYAETIMRFKRMEAARDPTT